MSQTVHGELEQVAKTKFRFLWASLLINDLCAQGSDEKIINTLASLPRDLPEFYTRVVNRISQTQQSQTMSEVFGWVVIVRQPLSISQNRDAIAIQPCQPYTMPKRLHNDINRIIEWSRGLLTLDEEDSTIQFAHPSVRQFFLADSKTEKPPAFEYNQDDLDIKAGDTCVTYLNFSDFERKLLKRPKDNVFSADNIVQTVMSNEARATLPRLISKFRQQQSYASSRPFKNLNRILESTGERVLVEAESDPDHPFLTYASYYWLHHTKSWLPLADRKTYYLWKSLLDNPSALIRIPWDAKDWEQRSEEVCRWIVEHDHAALFEYVRLDFLEMDSRVKLVTILSNAFRDGGYSIVKHAPCRLGKTKGCFIYPLFCTFLASSLHE